MDSRLLTSTLNVTESHPQSRSSRSRRTSTGSVDTPLFSGRAVMKKISIIATRRHSYSASLNNDTSLSSSTQTLYAVGETGDRNSVSVSYLHFMNHLTKKMVVGQGQVSMSTISVSQLKVWTSSHRQWLADMIMFASQSMSSKSGKLHPSDTNITKSEATGKSF